MFLIAESCPTAHICVQKLVILGTAHRLKTVQKRYLLTSFIFCWTLVTRICLYKYFMIMHAQCYLKNIHPSCIWNLSKVTVRCGCQTLKKEWLCKDVQAAYRKMDRDPKDISKTQFGYGLLPCGSDCKSKVQVVESELTQRKPEVNGVMSFIMYYRNFVFEH